MPVYEFVCENCGPFEVLRPLEEAGEPSRCPVCGALASRVFSAPLLTRTPASVAAAHARNERSAHEPEIVKRPRSETPPAPARPPRGHGRPWQIGH